MALDQNLIPSTPKTLRESAIENELPAYRAISPHAVLSLIVGMLSILAFTNTTFYLFALVAIILGIYAERQIRRYPEIWTGEKLAQAGKMLGFIFAVAAFTFTFSQDLVLKRDAGRFAQHFLTVVKTGTFEDAVWYSTNPEAREAKSSAQVWKEIKTGTRDPRLLSETYDGLEKLKAKAATKGVEVHFEGLESRGYEGVTAFGTALLGVHLPAEKGKPESEEFALFIMKGMSHKGKRSWWVESTRYPYDPKSFVAAAKPVDDGHGHAH